MLVHKTVLIVLDGIEAKVEVEVREEASDETNQLTALSILKARASNELDKRTKPQVTQYYGSIHH